MLLLIKYILGRTEFSIIVFTRMEKSGAILKQIQKFEKEILKKSNCCLQGFWDKFEEG